MPSFLIRVSVVAALLQLVQGSADTGIITEVYTTSDCSGAAKKLDEDRENFCREDDDDGTKIYRKDTCIATHAVRTYYSDSTCSTPSVTKLPEQKPLACTEDGGKYVKMTCGKAVSIGTMKQFSQAECPTNSTKNMHSIVYTSGCRPKSEDETDDDGNVTWTDKSETVTVKDGALVVNYYSSLDCSGEPSTSRSYMCTGACTAMPESTDTWYTITDCLDETGKAPAGTAQTGEDGKISIVATVPTASSSHRMSASGAGGLVALLAATAMRTKQASGPERKRTFQSTPRVESYFV